jgi:hypothetical protein
MSVFLWSMSVMPHVSCLYLLLSQAPWITLGMLKILHWQQCIRLKWVMFPSIAATFVSWTFPKIVKQIHQGCHPPRLTQFQFPHISYRNSSFLGKKKWRRLSLVLQFITIWAKLKSCATDNGRVAVATRARLLSTVEFWYHTSLSDETLVSHFAASRNTDQYPVFVQKR